MKDTLIIAGAGGQGALRIGQMIAYAALDSGREVEWMPSYGAEMRGGTANCNVVISDESIPFCMAAEPDCLIVMNKPSLDKFGSSVRQGGAILMDSSNIAAGAEPARPDLSVYPIPAGSIAEEEGNPRGANMVLLGAYISIARNISLEAVCKVIDRSFTGSKARYAEANKRLVQLGIETIEGLLAHSTSGNS